MNSLYSSKSSFSDDEIAGRERTKIVANVSRIVLFINHSPFFIIVYSITAYKRCQEICIFGIFFVCEGYKIQICRQDKGFEKKT